MRLVNDDVVKSVWLNLVQHTILGQCLHCCENKLAVALFGETCKFAKIVVVTADDASVLLHCFIEDLLAVNDK